jgi:hypothetical protein
MIQKPMTWPDASGVFNAPRTLVMTTAPHTETRRNADTLLVTTPLDLIRHLEDPSNGLVTIILTGRFAADQDLISFLREGYRVELVVEPPVVELFDLSEELVA